MERRYPEGVLFTDAYGLDRRPTACTSGRGRRGGQGDEDADRDGPPIWGQGITVGAAVTSPLNGACWVIAASTVAKVARAVPVTTATADSAAAALTS